jgi:hypothetical protein
MVNQCANPRCCKPLHYLREGRIFVFDMPDQSPIAAPAGGRGRRLQHFWLCGPCSEVMVMKQTGDHEIEVAMKTGKIDASKAAILPTALAI